jgi:sialic acid synthase SpsE
MDTLRQAFGVSVGFSDHTPGRAVALAAVARGAEILEKHLTLSHELPGPDHLASLEPVEFAALVREVREVESCLGDGRKVPQACEWPIREIARKSLVTAAAVPAGTAFSEANLAVRRPGTGLEPGQRGRVLGRRAARDLPAFHVLQWDDLA